MTEVIDTPVTGEEVPALPKPTRTLIESWLALLSNIELEEAARIPPSGALAILRQWSGVLTLDSVALYFETYYEYLKKYRNVLLDVLAANPDLVKNVEDDAEANREVYLDVLLGWNIVSNEIERSWDINTPAAGAEVAALAASHQIILGQQGIIAHLDQIGFVLTPEDQESLSEAVMLAEGEQS